LQALALLNNPFMTAMSNALAKRAGTIDKAFQFVTGRSASREEADMLHTYSNQHGLAAASRLLFNLNEFSYVD
ncbi:MAG: DUF1553 domain-containing protein, partial [Verrucomicrobiales bacterium]|nr:DUF1553 domain-containing protein [Verrucomicrobiales bacterium]